MPPQEDIIVGLDIGTTKICAVVGVVSGNEISIIGIGSHPSIGLRKGVVVDIESTVESIKKAVEEAELMAGCEISSVYAGIAGGHITGFNSRGIIAIKGQEITQQDVERVIGFRNMLNKKIGHYLFVLVVKIEPYVMADKNYIFGEDVQRPLFYG